jgi:putative endonuclease
MTNNVERGRRGEEIAAEYLEGVGYRILRRNWRCRQGEIDIVAAEGDAVVVVEVKTRFGHGAGHPLEAVTPSKLARLRLLAGAWLLQNPDAHGRSIQIDVIGITLRPDGSHELLHFEQVSA